MAIETSMLVDVDVFMIGTRTASSMMVLAVDTMMVVTEGDGANVTFKIVRAAVSTVVVLG